MYKSSEFNLKAYDIYVLYTVNNVFVKIEPLVCRT